jgi:uncharacterized Fe-S radical SAM superfamily protein PflX
MTTNKDRGEVCSMCRFWNQIDENQGYCQIRAPQVIRQNIHYGSSSTVSGSELQTAFPVTEPTEWCGEWERDQ